MSLKINRLLRQRKTEIIITIALFIFAISLILLSSPHNFVEVGGKLGFSLLVALIVRWVTVLFSEAETSEDCDRSDYHEAIKTAHRRIWIYQTWLPDIGDGTEILNAKASDKRLLLLSFKQASPVYARIKGREMELNRAQVTSANSVESFVKAEKTDCVKFNYGHHPGWIAVIDSFVFCGPTPVNKNSLAMEFLFRKYRDSSQEGSFWVDQFEVMWGDYSHSFDEEKKYNPYLP